jgi:AcrR family transcriptional regulator
MSSQAVRSTKAHVVSDFRRSQILAAARQSFTRHGVTRTTVETIAKTAGLAKGTVYLYYRSKDDMLQQVLTEDLAELKDDAARCLIGPASIEDRLRRFLSAVISFFERRRDFIEHCQLEMGPDVRKKAKQKLQLVFSAQTESWRAVLREESARGTLRATDVDAVARTIVSLAHGMSIQRLRGWQTDPLDEAVAAAVSLVLHGVTAS